MRSAAVLALFAGVAVAIPSYQPEEKHEPEPVYETETHTVSSCPPEYPYCPGATETEHPVPSETPYEPVHPEEPEEPVYPEHPEEPEEPVYPEHPEEPEMTTSVVYTTKVETVTACPSTKTDCPAESHTVHVETHTIPLYTTVCPVSSTETHKSYETHVPVETKTLTECSYCPPKETHVSSVETHKPEETHKSSVETHYPEETETHVAPVETHAPYPTKEETHAPYPTGTETHYPVYPTGTAAPSTTVDALPEFTGAASSINAGMALAGLGAIAAFFI